MKRRYGSMDRTQNDDEVCLKFDGGESSFQPRG